MRALPRTVEKLALTDEQRAERLRRLAERLGRPDGLDHDALAQIEELRAPNEMAAGPGAPFIKSDPDRAAHNQERDAVRDDE